MVKLFCAIPGTRGSAFSVEVDEDETVDDLKKVIKKENPSTITCDTKDLQLFLTKTGERSWLSSKDPDVISMRSGSIPERVKALLNVEMDPADEIGDLFDDVPKKTVHVLVVVPQDERSGTGVPAALPEGPVVNLSACEGLLAFLEGEMTNKHAIISRPHILDDDSLEFQLVGREEAIKTAAGCFSNIIIARSSTTTTYRTRAAQAPPRWT
ncbi:unnamed protein product [Phytophthora lilii]|uniref:Unnamed protein product n=1 Tax=Phytophthora lilii TaxID=2077276 RepID=A0A9W6UBH6_9STRA|nr:unnamed protein product [Phytophthora lilii]